MWSELIFWIKIEVYNIFLFSDQKINENSDHVELLCLLKQNNDDRKRSLTYNNQIHLLSSNKIKEINFPARTNKRTTRTNKKTTRTNNYDYT